MTIELKEFDLSPLESALSSLKEAFENPPRNDLERDGAIQRFEFTFELSWKVIRKFLKSLGRHEISGSPKPLFRDALEEGLIDQIEEWFEFLEARNLTSHIYSKKQAEKVYTMAKNFPPFVEKLLQQIKKKIS